MSAWLSRHKVIKRIASVTALFAFITSVVLSDAWAVIDKAGSPHERMSSYSPAHSALLDPGTFTIPAYLGEIKDKWRPPSTPSTIHHRPSTVVHIQDAHCNYAAQHKIADIIKYLNKEYDISTVNLEGGKGDYDLSVFTGIADKKIREEVSDYFVKEGLVSGAEYTAINRPDNIRLWGVEDAGLYLENLNIYRESLKGKGEMDKYLRSLRYALNNLKRHIYSKELLEFDVERARYTAGGIDFKDYAVYLMDKAERKAIDIEEYRNIELLRRSLEQEERIDFKKANLERDLLIDRLRKILSNVEMEELVLKTVQLKQKRISPRDFYAYLVKKAEGVNIGLDDYLELQKYVAYISAYSEADKSTLMKEIRDLENKIKEALYENARQKELDRLSGNLALTQDLFNVGLNREDYKYYKEHEDEFAVYNYISFINREAPLHGITVEFDAGIRELDTHREKMVSFYECSFKRDKAFLKNMIFPRAPSTIHHPLSTVLITGGFHTENLCELFREKGISYVSITPTFISEKGYECPYFRLLAGRQNGVEKKISTIFRSSIAISGFLNGLAVLSEGDIWPVVNELHVKWKAAVASERKGLIIRHRNDELILNAAGNVVDELTANERLGFDEVDVTQLLPSLQPCQETGDTAKDDEEGLQKRKAFYKAKKRFISLVGFVIVMIGLLFNTASAPLTGVSHKAAGFYSIPPILLSGGEDINIGNIESDLKSSNASTRLEAVEDLLEKLNNGEITFEDVPKLLKLLLTQRFTSYGRGYGVNDSDDDVQITSIKIVAKIAVQYKDELTEKNVNDIFKALNRIQKDDKTSEVRDQAAKAIDEMAIIYGSLYSKKAPDELEDINIESDLQSSNAGTRRKAAKALLEKLDNGEITSEDVPKLLKLLLTRRYTSYGRGYGVNDSDDTVQVTSIEIVRKIAVQYKDELTEKDVNDILKAFNWILTDDKTPEARKQAANAIDELKVGVNDQNKEASEEEKDGDVVEDEEQNTDTTATDMDNKDGDKEYKEDKEDKETTEGNKQQNLPDVKKQIERKLWTVVNHLKNGRKIHAFSLLCWFDWGTSNTEIMKDALWGVLSKEDITLEARQIIARNIKAPWIVLRDSYEDNDMLPEIAIAIFANPSISIDRLKRLVEKKLDDSVVYIGLAKNPNMTIRLLRDLLEQTSHEEVRRQIFQTIKYRIENGSKEAEEWLREILSTEKVDRWDQAYALKTLNELLESGKNVLWDRPFTSEEKKIIKEVSEDSIFRSELGGSSDVLLHPEPFMHILDIFSADFFTHRVDWFLEKYVGVTDPVRLLAGRYMLALAVYRRYCEDGKVKPFDLKTSETEISRKTDELIYENTLPEVLTKVWNPKGSTHIIDFMGQIATSKKLNELRQQDAGRAYEKLGVEDKDIEYITAWDESEAKEKVKEFLDSVRNMPTDKLNIIRLFAHGVKTADGKIVDYVNIAGNIDLKLQDFTDAIAHAVNVRGVKPEDILLVLDFCYSGTTLPKMLKDLEKEGIKISHSIATSNLDTAGLSDRLLYAISNLNQESPTFNPSTVWPVMIDIFLEWGVDMRFFNGTREAFMGKVFDSRDEKKREIKVGGIVHEEEGEYICFYHKKDGEFLPLYTKDGKEAKVKVLKDEKANIKKVTMPELWKEEWEHLDESLLPAGLKEFLKNPSGREAILIEDNENIRGFTDGRKWYLTEAVARFAKEFKNGIPFVHELVEGYFASLGDKQREEELPKGVNAHVYLRGVGWDIREFVARLDKRDIAGLDAEKMIERLETSAADGSVRSLTDVEKALINYNGVKMNRTGVELLYGLQDILYGYEANNKFSGYMKASSIYETAKKAMRPMHLRGKKAPSHMYMAVGSIEVFNKTVAFMRFIGRKENGGDMLNIRPCAYLAEGDDWKANLMKEIDKRLPAFYDDVTGYADFEPYENPSRMLIQLMAKEKDGETADKSAEKEIKELIESGLRRMFEKAGHKKNEIDELVKTIIENKVKFVYSYAGRDVKYLNPVTDLFMHWLGLECGRHGKPDGYREKTPPRQLVEKYLAMLRSSTSNYGDLVGKLNIRGKEAANIDRILEEVFSGYVLIIKAINWESIPQWTKAQNEVLRRL